MKSPVVRKIVEDTAAADAAAAGSLDESQ